MKLPRRNFLHLAAGAAALPALSRFAWAQTYPSRPVRIVVGFTVGGFYDTYARLIAQWLSQHLGQPFVIENRTGAGGSIATEVVVRAALMGTPCSLLAQTMLGTRLSMIISVSITSATSRRSPASPREWAFWSCLRRFQPGRFTNSSPTQETTRRRSRSHQTGSAADHMSSGNCSGA